MQLYPVLVCFQEKQFLKRRVSMNHLTGVCSVRVLALVCFLCACTALSIGQVTTVDDTTSTPIPGAGHDYIHLLSETVNPANGSVSLRINIPVPKARGITLPFSFSYDSNSVNHLVGSVTYPGFAHWQSNTGYLSQGGWSFSVPMASASSYTDTFVMIPNNLNCSDFTNYMFSDPSGGQHSLALATQWYQSGGPQGVSDYQCPQSSLSVATSGDPVVLAKLPNIHPDTDNPSATAAAPLTVFTADGTVYTFPILSQHFYNNQYFSLPTSMEDRNGNIVNFTDNGNGAFSVEDTAGRNVFSSNGFGGSTNILAIGGLSYQVAWTNTTANFPVPPQNWVGNSNGPNSPYDTCNGIQAGSTTQPVVSKIILPNNQTYQFHYGTDNPNPAFQNPYGLLNEIIYPDGGWVQYSWKWADQYNQLLDYPGYHQVACGPNGGGFCTQPVQDGCLYQYASPVVKTREVGFTSNGSPVLTQSFTYGTSWNTGGSNPGTTWTSRSTTVATTDNVRNEAQNTIYTYSPYTTPSNDPLHTTNFPPQIPLEQKVQYYDFGGSLLKQVNKTWNNPNQLASEQTQLPNGSGYITSQTTYSYTQFSLETAKNEWDYATPLSGSPARMTTNTYQTFTGTPGDLVDKECSVVVCSGGSSCTSTSSNKISETDYLYDGSAGAVCASVSAAGATGQITGSLVAGTHDETLFSYSSTTPRGNVTQKIQWLNNGTSPTTKYSYDETGQITSLTDPCGNQACSDVTGTNHTTTYSYADSYSSGTPTGVTNTYLTKVTHPTTSGGVTLTESYKYSYADGQLTSATDANSNITTYKYNTTPTGCSFADGLDRLTEIDSPDSGVTTNCYNDNANTVTTSKLIDSTSNTYLTTETLMDGVGHAIQTQQTTDPDGADYVDTVYDGFGRVLTQSNPHRSASLPTDGTTTYTYDGLGRTTILRKPDSSLVSTIYSVGCTSSASEPSTTVTDEAGNMRSTCSDALGRLIEVDEPGAGASAGGVGSGTITIGGQEQTIAGASGSASVTISGAGQCRSNGYVYVPDTGSVSITVYGAQTATSTYNWSGSCNGSTFTGATPSSVASQLASFLSSSTAGVTATANNSSITITAKATGPATNYSLTYGCSGSCDMTASGPSALAGGKNAIQDSGTVLLTVGGFPVSYSYSSADTSTSIASALTADLNGSGSPVNAQLSGSTITVTANTGGSASNYSLSGSTTWNHSFSSPSFNISDSGSSLAGGANGGLGTAPLVTLYSYDGLNDVVSVQQQGGTTTSSLWRTRTFTYDSLARIVCAANPEIQSVTCPASATGTFPFGAVTYSYDANGNFATKVMPKAGGTSGTAVTTHNYTYDVLNRLLSDTHLDPSAGKDLFGYDGIAISGCPGPGAPKITGATNLLGRKSSMCAPNSASSFSYDKVGRVATDSSSNKGSSLVTLKTGYTYWKDGSLDQLTYPSGDVVTYVVKGAGRVTQVTDSSANYVTGAAYAPHGALIGMTNGANIINTNAYDNRLQPILLSAAVSQQSSFFSLCYDFHPRQALISNTHCPQINASTTGNNGNVFQIFNTAVTDATYQTVFQYDLLNRLSQANTATTGANCWTEVYTIDTWSNLTNRSGLSSMGGCTTEPMNAPATVQNHLTGVSYDIAGNVLKDPTGNALTYDAENRVATDAGYTYSYDAGGFRMEKANGSTGTMYWAGPGGALAETDLTGVIDEEYVFFNGQRIARIDRQASGTPVHYYFSDHLGSASVITDSSGNVQERCAYYPYGGQVYCTGSDPNHYKFTGKERDSESNMDNFGARYFASSTGRFMTPDWAARPTAVPYALFGDPQSLNLYTYVRNDPVSRADADGHLSFQFMGDDGSGLGSADVREESGIANDAAQKKDEPQNTSTQPQPFTVTVNSRPADIPGGQTLDKAGVDHQWITTSDGASAGMGTAKGVPQSDAPGVKTQVVDHTGQVPTKTVTYTNVDKTAINTYLKVGTPTGRWVPGVNDCNTWVANAIHQSTPHDITMVVPMSNAPPIVLYHNAVVYADGSIH
jgi:RHS repeat-associated protein